MTAVDACLARSINWLPFPQNYHDRAVSVYDPNKTRVKDASYGLYNPSGLVWSLLCDKNGIRTFAPP